MASMAITSSGALTSSAVVLVGPGRVHGIIVTTSGTNVASAVLTDSPDATLTGDVELLRLSVPAGTSSVTQSISLPEQGIEVNKGIYLTISGTSAQAIVLYSVN